jgi:hypothetical protein
MVSTPDQYREELGMESWPDKQLVHILAQRFVEQSVVTQLMTVSAEAGTAFGIELLLTPEIEGERSPDFSRDTMLDAMITEVRRRIAARLEDGAYTING